MQLGKVGKQGNARFCHLDGGGIVGSVEQQGRQCGVERGKLGVDVQHAPEFLDCLRLLLHLQINRRRNEMKVDIAGYELECTIKACPGLIQAAQIAQDQTVFA